MLEFCKKKIKIDRLQLLMSDCSDHRSWLNGTKSFIPLT